MRARNQGPELARAFFWGAVLVGFIFFVALKIIPAGKEKIRSNIDGHSSSDSKEANYGKTEQGKKIFDAFKETKKLDNALRAISKNEYNIDEYVKPLVDKDGEPIPDVIVNYFEYFQQLQDFVNEKKEYDSKIHWPWDDKIQTELTTEYFINNSSVITTYFDDISKSESQYQASIVPYYFIKKYNSQDQDQGAQRNIYNSYIDKYIIGADKLSNEMACVLCLSIYSEWCSCNSLSDLSSLKKKLENFQIEYSDYFGENEQNPYSMYLNDALYKITEVLGTNKFKNKDKKKYELHPFTANNQL